ncbi:MAG TPA: HupE/UreJ family protein [Pseudolabrys sp.]|jgi:urease accessory protein|nr:HupE/UreJ family protein [Pseudolabrys sp.]
MHFSYKRMTAIGCGLAGLFLAAEPALAHHVMGGRMPATFGEGFLSGLGHPVIGLDHFAAVVAVGCLAAAHRAGAVLALGFVAAMMLGVAAHLGGTTVPGAELLVALTVIGLGVAVVRTPPLPAAAAVALFIAAGLVHGYALGESIYGAERAPLAAYLVGLAIIQSAIALAAMSLAQRVSLAVRLAGAAIAGVGLTFFVQQIVPAV